MQEWLDSYFLLNDDGNGEGNDDDTYSDDDDDRNARMVRSKANPDEILAAARLFPRFSPPAYFGAHSSGGGGIYGAWRVKKCSLKVLKVAKTQNHGVWWVRGIKE